MEAITFNDPCILFPLRRESHAFRKLFPPSQPFPGAPCRAHFCGASWLSVLVLETGIGAGRTATALDWLASQPEMGNVAYRPKLILSAGFCGALKDGYRVGDVILADEVADEAGNRWPATWPRELPPGSWDPPLHRGRLLSVPRVLGTPEEKQAHGTRHGAPAVDLESATVAAFCTRHGIPFGCVRVVSDDAHTPLSPRLASLLSDGRVSPWPVAKLLFRSPGSVRELWRLARQTRHAGEQLGKALGELLTLTLSWADG